MTIEFRLPDLGENQTEGQVVQVLVRVGDVVEQNQPVIELETDKALLEVPSPARGRVASIGTEAGKKLRVNDLILVIDEAGAGAAPAAKSAAPLPQAAKSAPEPARKAEPPPAQKNEPPRAAPPPAPAPARPAAPPPLAQAAQIEDPEAAAADHGAAEVLDVPKKSVSAAPSTRKLARELGVEISQVKPSGPGGQVTKEDVLAHVKNRGAKPAAPAAPGIGAAIAQASALPDFAQWGPIDREAMSNIRKRTVERMTLSWGTIPHVTQVDEADITDLMALRDRHSTQAAEKGGKLTVTVFVLKAVVSALKAFPQFNASIDLETEEIIFKRYYHLGIAVDTDHGLLVPVIRDVDRRRLIELSADLLVLSERARERKVKLEDLRGATFTITNLGGIGGTAFTPIINYPEVAILGLARTQKRLVMSKNGIETRMILPLCLSYDHRVIDGADAVRFTRKIASMLEDPALLLLEP